MAIFRADSILRANPLPWFVNWAVNACMPNRLPLLWVFPPFELTGAVLGKLKMSKLMQS